MTVISLQLPQVGQPNATEEPKTAANFTTLQSAINGQLGDGNLTSPTTATRRLLMQSIGLLIGQSGTFPSGTYVFERNGSFPVTGTNIGSSDAWPADTGLSGQPLDFQAAGKTLKARVRVSYCTNTVTFTGGQFNFGLYQQTSPTAVSVVPGSQVLLSSPVGGVCAGVESPEFTMPTTPGLYLLGMAFTLGATGGSAILGTVQLLGYNV